MRKRILSFAMTILLLSKVPLISSAAEVTFLESPTAEPSSLSRVFSDNTSGIILSWVEPDGKSDSLYFSTLNKNEFSKPQMIASGSDWFVNWADFPFVISNGRSMTAHWLKQRDEGTYNYDVVAVFRSAQTQNWSEPKTIHTDGVSAEHGFVGMLPLSGDQTLISWLDGRDTDGHGLGGMTLRAGVFDADGNTVTEWEVDNLVCDCCQTSIAMSSEGPVLAYRNRTEAEVRDIYITRLENESWTTPRPIYTDNWEITGCPVNGPSVAAQHQQVAVGWFSAKDNLPKVNLSLSSDNGGSFRNTVTVAQQNTNGRVSVAILGSGKVVISWLETAGKTASIKVAAYSEDGDLLDSATVGETVSSRQSGFPVITSRGEDVFVTWTEVTPEKKQIKVARVRF